MRLWGKFVLLILGVFLCKTSVAQQIFSFADLVEELQPVVVNISTTHLPGDENIDDSLGIISPNPQLHQYFLPDNNQNVSLGSGFIIEENGYVLTNNHVIDKAQRIVVTTSDESVFEADVVGTDIKTDLALIKLKTDKKFEKAKLGDSDVLRVGDQILTIGNPFGLGGSVSAGIVSAKARDIEAGSYDSFIQTDASINQGSSGGPMFNIKGEVVGINSAIYSTHGGNMGIGFATPINLAKFVISELKNKGKVERGWLGIKIRLQPEDNGIVVSSVSEMSPANKAGVEAGDIIVELNGKKVGQPRDFSIKIAETAPNQSIDLKILRNGTLISKTISLELMPELRINPKAEKKEAFNTYFAGLNVVEINDIEKQKYQITTSEYGVLVDDVEIGSDAEAKGIKKGDFITEVDKQPIVTKQDFIDMVNNARRESNRQILIKINNNNNPLLVTVKP